MNRRTKILIFIVFFIGSFATAYFRNTSKSTTPSATPQTTRVIVPTGVPTGWTRLKGKGVALQLPDSFMGGDIQDFAVQISAMSTNDLSPQSASILQEALKNPDQFVLLAIDRTSAKAFLTNINIVKGRLSEERYPLDQILQSTLKQYPQEVQVIESAVVKINDIEVIRIVDVMKTQTVSAKQLQYIRIDESNNAWITNFSTAPNEFNRWLPIFEKSYQSLELIPVTNE